MSNRLSLVPFIRSTFVQTMAGVLQRRVPSAITRQRERLCLNCTRETHRAMKDFKQNHDVLNEGELMEDYAWKSRITSSLLLAWHQNLYTDITIVAKDETIQAHKLILAVASPYFRALLSANLSESHSSLLKLEDTRGETLRVVLEYIYSGRARLTEENVAEVLPLADYFQIHDLKRLCCMFIKSHLAPSFCLPVYELALLHQCQDLAASAFQIALKNCSEAISDPSFLSLQPQTLVSLFQEQILYITSEDELFKALREWISFDEERRNPWYPTLLSLLKEDQLNPLSRSVFHEELEERGMRELYKRSVLPSQNCHSLKSRHKKEEELLIVFGGESNGRIMSNAECIAIGFSSWRCSIPSSMDEARDLNQVEGQQVIPPMQGARKHAAVAVKDNVVYLIGGQTREGFLETCETYHVSSNLWGTFPSLPLRLHGAEAVFLQDKLWVVGGRSDNGDINSLFSLLVYDSKKETWCFRTPMLEGRVHFGVAAIHDSLFAIGGIGTGREHGNFALDSCEKYDVETNSWMRIASLGRRRAYHRVAVIDDVIYAVGGYDGAQWLSSVERYDPLKDRWTSVSPMIGTRSSFGITVSYGRLYCIGGFSGETVLNTAEKYNPKTDAWHCVQSMRLRRYGLVAATLKLPTEKLTTDRYNVRFPDEGHEEDRNRVDEMIGKKGRQ